jgi:uncharacterized protein YecE (DUF72 family)
LIRIPTVSATIDATTPMRAVAPATGAPSRSDDADEELRRVRALIDGRPAPYVMFNNLPRVGDAQRFLDLL